MRSRRFGVVALWAAALLGSAGGGEVGAADVYWAFGDSITWAAGLDGETFPSGQHFCGTPDVPYPPNPCGYQGRLQASLGKTVWNRGRAGETTAGGLTRIVLAGEPLETDRCSDSEAGDVVLIMEGTNDGGQSALTNKANLAFIVDLATSKCVHSAIATLIRRLQPSPIGWLIGDPDHPYTADLSSKISDISIDKNRALVDVYASICPIQDCFFANYWPYIVNGDPGHIDASGYDLMEPIFYDLITDRPVAGAVTNLSPSTNITDTTPTFSWNEQIDSDWYFLEVNGGASHGSWYPEEAICSGGSCLVTPGGMMPGGHHSWRVRTRNLQGVGAWSATQAFSIGLPGPANPMTPTGDIFDATPDYTWTEAADATGYEIELEDSLGGVGQPDTSAPSCGGGTCSVTTLPGGALSAGAYAWRVRGTNGSGEGPWSGQLAFTLYTAAPAAPTLVYPLDDVFATSPATPTYRWLPVLGATTYDVKVDGTVPAALDNLLASIHCTNALCEVAQPTSLTVGANTWTARAGNIHGEGPFAGLVSYELLACSPPDLVVDDVTMPPFRACGTVSTAVSGFTVGFGGGVIFHAGSKIELGDGFVVESGGSFTGRVDY